jgi:dynamin 1-like protein
MDPFEVLSDEEIRTQIKNSNGLQASLFVSETAFENLIKLQIYRLKEPSLQCSMLVYEELRSILNMINMNEIQRFDNLRSRIFEVMEDVLANCMIPTNKMIRDVIEIETGYINSNHPDFIGGIGIINNNDSIPAHNNRSGGPGT